MLRVMCAIDVPYPRVVAMIGPARAYARLGRYDAALDHARAAREAASGCSFAVLENLALAALADALARAGRPGEAAGHARAALDSDRRIGHRLGEAHTLALLGRVSGPAGGAGYRQAARDLFAEIGVPVPAELREQAVS